MTKIDWTMIEALLKPALDRKPERGEADRARMGTLGTEFDMGRENRNNFG